MKNDQKRKELVKRINKKLNVAIDTLLEKMNDIEFTTMEESKGYTTHKHLGVCPKCGWPNYRVISWTGTGDQPKPEPLCNC